MRGSAGTMCPLVPIVALAKTHVVNKRCCSSLRRRTALGHPGIFITLQKRPIIVERDELQLEFHGPRVNNSSISAVHFFFFFICTLIIWSLRRQMITGCFNPLNVHLDLLSAECQCIIFIHVPLRIEHPCRQISPIESFCS